jgi:hypothetical protein
MGLSTALAKLNADRTLDGVVHDVLLLFRQHPREGFTAAEVAQRTGRPLVLVEPILRTLGGCFVLDCHSDPRLCRYVPDAVLEMDVQEYLQRVDRITGRLQNNVARFRQRHDHF